jgi:hypothetical protein
MVNRQWNSLNFELPVYFENFKYREPIHHSPLTILFQIISYLFTNSPVTIIEMPVHTNKRFMNT